MARPKKPTGNEADHSSLDRLKLRAFIDSINLKHNKTSLIMAEAGEDREEIGRISTGHYAIDEILGGGIPRGRITEVYGSESAGKSSLALQIVREAQKMGLRVAYVDVEQAIDPEYCDKIGVKWDDIVFSQPDSAEEALDIVDAASRSGLFGLVVLDSVAALVTKRELEGEVGDATMAEVARLMSSQLKKQISPAKKQNCAILYLNQIRCLPSDTLIQTSDGFKRLGDVAPEDHILGPGGFVRVLSRIDSGMVSGKRISVKMRGTFDLSDNHVQPIVRDGLRVDVAGAQIRPGDWLIQPIADCHPAGDHYDDDDRALFQGMYFADGSINGNVRFTEQNRERHALVTAQAHKLYGESSVRHHSWRNISITGKQVVLDCLEVGNGASRKTIPKAVLGGGIKSVRSFLRGASFDTHINGSGLIFSIESNPKAARDFVAMLYSFGVIANWYRDPISGGDRLHITGRDLAAYMDRVGVAEGWKREKLLAIITKNSMQSGARGKYDVVPRDMASRIIKKCLETKTTALTKCPDFYAITSARWRGLNQSRERMIRLCRFANNDEDANNLSRVRFAEVQSVSDATFHACDIEVEDHYFVATQFVTHNSGGMGAGRATNVTSGGRALKFYASLRIELSSWEQIKLGELVIGQRVVCKTKKNKTAPPHRQTTVDLRFPVVLGGAEQEPGYDDVGAILDAAVEKKIIAKGGAWFTYGDQKFQGREAARQFVKDTPEIRKAVLGV